MLDAVCAARDGVLTLMLADSLPKSERQEKEK